LNVFSDIDIGDAYQRPHDLVELLDGLETCIHKFPRNRQSESDSLSSFADCGIDAYHIAIDIQERTAAVSCIDGCVRLE